MKNKNLATYKEFAKMLHEVANLCEMYGDTPLEDTVPDLKEKCYYVTNRGAYDAYIAPWLQEFSENPIDVTRAKEWASEVQNKKE